MKEQDFSRLNTRSSLLRFPRLESQSFLWSSALLFWMGTGFLLLGISVFPDHFSKPFSILQTSIGTTPLFGTAAVVVSNSSPNMTDLSVSNAILPIAGSSGTFSVQAGTSIALWQMIANLVQNAPTLRLTPPGFYALLQIADDYNPATRSAQNVRDAGTLPYFTDANSQAYSSFGQKSSTYFGSFSSWMPSFNYTPGSSDAGHIRFFRICADKSSGSDATGLIPESDESNNCGEWTPITVTTVAPANMMNLDSPNMVSVSNGSTYTGTLRWRNSSGSGSTNVVLEKADSYDWTTGSSPLTENAINLQDVASTTGFFGAGTSINTFNVTYNFPARDYNTVRYLRFCVDKTSAVDPGSIAESSEDDNCTRWTAFSISSTGVPTFLTASLSATSPLLIYNQPPPDIASVSTAPGSSRWPAVAMSTTVTNDGDGAYDFAGLPPTLHSDNATWGYASLPLNVFPQYRHIEPHGSVTLYGIPYSFRPTIAPEYTPQLPAPGTYWPSSSSQIIVPSLKFNFYEPSSSGYSGLNSPLSDTVGFNADFTAGPIIVGPSTGTTIATGKLTAQQQAIWDQFIATGNIPTSSTPMEIIADAPTQFNAIIANIGYGSVFQYAVYDVSFRIQSGSTNPLFSSQSVSGYNLPAFAGSVGNTTYTFSRAYVGQTVNLQACANVNSQAVLSKVPESNQTNNCGPWTSFKVLGPDLTPRTAPGLLSQTSAVGGTARDFTMDIANIGSITTGTGTFTNVLQKAYDATGSGQTSVATNTAGSVKAGAFTSGFSINYTFPTSDNGTTRYLRICADEDVNGAKTVIENDETNNCGAWTPIMVTPTSMPDLVVSADATTSPANPLVGANTTLNAAVINGGTASTGASFNNIFQIDNDADHNTSFATSTMTISSLAPLATSAISVIYQFPSAGTYYVRACADENASMVGSVLESNENNNCGNWITATVVNPPAPDLTASGIVPYPSPASATSGVAKVFSATISNNGTLTTSTSFPSLLQRADAWDGTTATNPQDISASTTPALSPSGTVDRLYSYTFLPGDAGKTRYLRVCADKADMNDQYGSIDEGPNHTGENNNCGAWSAVAVASPYAVLVPGSINAQNVAYVPPKNFFSRAMDSIASILLPSAHAVGNPVAGQPLQLSIPITNNGVTTATSFVNEYFVDINNDGTALVPGVTTGWDLTYSTTTNGISANGVVNALSTIRSNSFVPSGSNGLPIGTHGIVFCADVNSTVSNPTETLASRCTTKTVQNAVSPPVPHTTVTADKETIYQGQSTTIRWSSTNSTSCSGNPIATGGATSGSASTGVLMTDENYQFTCDDDDPITQGDPGSVTVTVKPAGVTTTFGSSIVSPNTTTTVTGTCTGSTHGKIWDKSGTVVVVNGNPMEGDADSTGLWTATFTTPAITAQTFYTTVCTPIIGGSDIKDKKFINLKTTITPF